jgi:hypothetical protein
LVAERPSQPVGSNDQRTASMRVTVKLKQQPFPLGLDRLQSLLEDSSEQDEVDVTPR